MKNESTLFSVREAPALTLLLWRWLEHGLPAGHKTKFSEQIITISFLAKSSGKDLEILFVSHQERCTNKWQGNQFSYQETNILRNKFRPHISTEIPLIYRLKILWLDFNIYVLRL